MMPFHDSQGVSRTIGCTSPSRSEIDVAANHQTRCEQCPFARWKWDDGGKAIVGSWKGWLRPDSWIFHSGPGPNTVRFCAFMKTSGQKIKQTIGNSSIFTTSIVKRDFKWSGPFCKNLLGHVVRHENLHFEQEHHCKRWNIPNAPPCAISGVPQTKTKKTATDRWSMWY